MICHLTIPYFYLGRFNEKESAKGNAAGRLLNTEQRRIQNHYKTSFARMNSNLFNVTPLW